MENSEKPVKRQKPNKVIEAIQGIIGICILIGLWLASSEVKDRLIGWVDLTGGKGGAQPAINLLITLVIFIGIGAAIIGLILGFAKVLDFFSSSPKNRSE